MLKPFFEFASRFQKKQVHTTNFAFKLITQITTNILLFILVAMFSSAFMLDKVISCYSDHPLKDLLSLKCWAEGVFIDRYLLNKTIGKDVLSPGVGAWKPQSDYVHQSYYQWIPPMLIMQCFILYLPKALWKLFERDTMQKLLTGDDAAVITEKWKDRRNNLVLYMKNIKKKHHRYYVIKYFFCECLSLAAVILNMFLMKWVINNFWVTYQPAIGAFIQGDLVKFRQESTILFPLQAKCNCTSFGGSGSMVNHDILCYLPLNVLNEKVFIFLYFWFIFILFIGALNLLYFLMMLMFNSLRILDVGRMSERTITRREVRKISGNGDFGYWFTLHILHKNLSPVFFQDLTKELSDKAEELPAFRKPKLGNGDDDEY